MTSYLLYQGSTGHLQVVQRRKNKHILITSCMFCMDEYGQKNKKNNNQDWALNIPTINSFKMFIPPKQTMMINEVSAVSWRHEHTFWGLNLTVFMWVSCEFSVFHLNIWYSWCPGGKASKNISIRGYWQLFWSLMWHVWMSLGQNKTFEDIF